MKRVLNVFMCFSLIIILTISCPLSISAETPGLTEENIVKSFIYVASTLGCLANKDFAGWYQISKDFYDMYTYTPEEVATQNDDGSITISDEVIDNFKSYLDNYIRDCGGYYFYEPMTIWQVHNSGDMSDEFFKLASQAVPSGSYGFVGFNNYRYISHLTIIDNPSSCYIVGAISSNKVTLYNSDLTTGVSSKHYTQSYDKYTDGSYHYGSVETSSEKISSSYKYVESQGILNTWNNSTPCLCSSGGVSVRIFKTFEDLRNYVRGTSTTNIYTSSVYNNYNVNNDNSVTIDKNTAEYILNTENNFTDNVTNISNNITNEINNYYTSNGTALTAEEIQVIVDNTIKKYMDSLPSGGNEEPSEPETPAETETPTEPETEPGTDVSGNTVSGNGGSFNDSRIVQWLEKIYNKICDTFDLVADKVVDGLKDIKNAIIGNIITDVAGTVAEIVAGGIDKIKDFVDTSAAALSEVGDLAQEKFPTCIPWDLIAIFAVMAVTPQAPVYELPFHIPSLGVDYTVTLDMSVFSPVSTVCRTVLTMIFLLGLIKFTVQITQKGGTD